MLKDLANGGRTDDLDHDARICYSTHEGEELRTGG
jgi:hypothetical protein